MNRPIKRSLFPNLSDIVVNSSPRGHKAELPVEAAAAIASSRRALRFFKWALGVTLLLEIIGCGPKPVNLSADESREAQQLRERSAEIQRLQKENAELPRLRQDFAELQRYTNIDSELAKLQTENAELRAALAKTGIKAEDIAAAGITGAAGGNPAAAGQTGAIDEATGAQAKPEDIPKEGDEILIPPEALGTILPGIDVSKLERKEPIAINNLLTNQGIAITNYQQLRDLGLTNFIIRRKPETAPQP